MPHSISPSDSPRNEDETLPDAPPPETTTETTENQDAANGEPENSKEKLEDLLFDDDDDDEYPVSSAPEVKMESAVLYVYRGFSQTQTRILTYARSDQLLPQRRK